MVFTAIMILRSAEVRGQADPLTQFIFPLDRILRSGNHRCRVVCERYDIWLMAASGG